MAPTSQDDLLGMDDSSSDSGPDLFFTEDVPTVVHAPAAEPDYSELDSAVAIPRVAKPDSHYVVLARKYRPQTFDEIVGQSNIQNALRGAIDTGKIGHAYLFSGPRGTGKTSIARILAKAVNCMEGGPRPDPCGKCASCRSITVGSSLDVIEIDAASNTGVDNIRDLKSGVALSPFSRYKVYIVDEVHMLSNQAFNALLKTLEEPPPQVIFVLATTELHKVPETIISRCQSFQFKRFTLDELTGQLGKILDTEAANREITILQEDRGKILDLISRSAEGGMRDAQVTLDQILILARGSLDFETVRRFLGLADSDKLDGFLLSLFNNETSQVLELIEELSASGQDLELYVKHVVEHIRDILVIRATGPQSKLVNTSDDRLASMKRVADLTGLNFLVTTSMLLLKTLEEMKTSSHPRFLLELAVLRAGLPCTDALPPNLLDRIEKLENQPPSSSPGPKTVAPVSKSETAVALVPPDKTEKISSATQGPVTQTTDSITSEPSASAELRPSSIPPSAPSAAMNINCDDVLQHLQQVTKDLMLGHMLATGVKILRIDQSTLVLGVDRSKPRDLKMLSSAGCRDRIKELATEKLGRPVQVQIEAANVLSVAEINNDATQPLTPQAQPSRTELSVNAPLQTVDASPKLRELASNAVVESGTPAANKPIKELKANGDLHKTDSDGNNICYTSEVVQKSQVMVTGDPLRKWLENRPELKELVENAKEVFRLDYTQIEARISPL